MKEEPGSALVEAKAGFCGSAHCGESTACRRPSPDSSAFPLFREEPKNVAVGESGATIAARDPPHGPADVIQEWRDQARALEGGDVLRAVEVLGEALASLREGREERLVVELALLRLARIVR